MTKLIFILLLGFYSCGKTEHADDVVISNVRIASSDEALRQTNDVLFYHDVPFSGVVFRLHTTGVVAEETSYRNGKQHGLSATWFANGKPEAQRWYAGGEKDSTHLGWYDSGVKRFEYHFKNGLTEGESSDWYPSGKPYQQIFYRNGNQESVKAWRENGKLYANYVVRNGVIYGLNNSGLCYTLKDEKGEYVKPK